MPDQTPLGWDEYPADHLDCDAPDLPYDPPDPL